MKKFALLLALVLAPGLLWGQSVLVVKDFFSYDGIPTDQIITSLQNLGYMNCPVWSVPDSAGGSYKPGGAVLSGYDAVIWEQSDFNKSGISDADTAAIGTYLASGGKVWLIAQNYISIIKYINSWPSIPGWLSADGDYTSWGGDPYGIDTLIGVAGDPIANGYDFLMHTPWTQYWDFPDTIFATNGTATVNFLHNKGGNSALWDTAYGSGGQLFFMTPMLEAVAGQADRDTLVKRTMAWFGLTVSYIDIACTQITQPQQTYLAAEDSILVQAELVSNCEEVQHSVPVTLGVDYLGGGQVYADTVTIDSIMPQETAVVDFPGFLIAATDTFVITVSNAMPDFNPGNDTQAKQVIIVEGLQFSEDFESGYGNWAGDWGVTDEYANSGTLSFTDSPYRNYYVNSDFMSAIDQTFNLASFYSAYLRFFHKYEIEPGYDYGYLMVSGDGGVTWDSVASYSGFQNDWTYVEYDLASYLTSSQMKFGFRMGSDALRVFKGWFIDDVVLVAMAVKDPAGVEGSGPSSVSRSSLRMLGPNPLRDNCRFSYQVNGRNAVVTARVYNLGGQLVRTLEQGERAPGTYQLSWDGRDSHGGRVSSGVYFLRMNIGGQAHTKQISVLR